MALNIIFEILIISYGAITVLFFDQSPIQYTKEEKATLLWYNGNFSVVNSTKVLEWNKTTPICFLIHGWKEYSEVDWITKLAQAYLDRNLCNVIIVDWSKRAGANYLTTISNLKIVGGYLGEFLVEIISGGYPTNNIEIIGYSFGAHVAGFAGKTVLNKTNHRIGSIRGLDPSLPLFWFAPSSDRLDKEDADFVSVISTNRFFFGTCWEWGDVTFIANDGSFQPNCPSEYVSIVTTALCSHEYSAQIQIKSIEYPFLYTASPCTPWRTPEESVYVSFNTRRDLTGLTGFYCFETE